jgi:hypothetical protein
MDALPFSFRNSIERSRKRPLLALDVSAGMSAMTESLGG